MIEEHPIEKCIKAQSRLRKAESNLNSIIDNINRIISKLKGWQNFGISDRYRILGESTRITEASTVIEARNWPTIQEIDTALQECHNALIDFQGEYNRLSEEHKKCVKLEPV